MSSKVFTIIGGLIVTVLFVTAAGLGVWGYSLNNQLTQSQADNQALQANYDNLNTEYTQAQADFKTQSEQAAAQLSQTQAELTAAQEQVAKLEGELKTAQSENEKLLAKLEIIKGKVDIFNTFWFDSVSAFEKKVESSGDSQLKVIYVLYKSSPTTDHLLDLMNYMIETIADVSDVN